MTSVHRRYFPNWSSSAFGSVSGTFTPFCKALLQARLIVATTLSGLSCCARSKHVAAFVNRPAFCNSTPQYTSGCEYKVPSAVASALGSLTKCNRRIIQLIKPGCLGGEGGTIIP